MRVVQIALGLAIVFVAPPSFAQQSPEKGARENGSRKAEGCRAKARQAGDAIRRGTSSSSIMSAQAGQERMRAYFLRCMARS
jgi:hypothetical protein